MGVFPEVAALVQEDFAGVGITVSVVLMDWVAFVGTLNGTDDYDMVLYQWTPRLRDSHDALFPVFHSTGRSNRTFYKCAVVDGLLDRAEIESGQDEREAIYAEVMRTLWDDAPWLFLYTPHLLTGVRREVHGLQVHPTGRIDASEAWLEH